MILLGREPELAACRAVLGRVEAPVGIVISGEPGIGKTALFRAVVDLAVGSGWHVLSTTGLQSEVEVPLANLVDLLDPAVGDVLAQLPAVQGAALRGALRLEAVTAPVEEALIVRATVSAMRALAGTRLLIAVDDEQWLDADTRRLLSTAASWLTDCPVVWLVSVRANQAESGLAQVMAHEFGPGLALVGLVGISSASMTRLVMDRFPGRWSPGLLRRIVELAAGNPYTALELARETIAAGGRDAVAVTVPTSLAGLLEARLGRLAPATRAAVQICSLTPQPSRRILRDLLGDETDGAVDEALEAEVLTASPPERLLWFTHPLLREVAQASLSGPGRRRLHRQLAEVVEDLDARAGHLAAGTEEPDEHVAEILDTAAAQARDRGAPARAASLAEAAIALSPDPDQFTVWELRVALLFFLQSAGELERARTLGEKWATTVPDQARGLLTFQRGGMAADSEAGYALMAMGLDELQEDPERAALMGCVIAGTAGGSLWRIAEGRAVAERAVRDARTAANPDLLRWALGVQGDLARRAGDPGAGSILLAAVAMPDSLDHPWEPCLAERYLAFWHHSRGQLGPARELLHQFLKASDRHGMEANVMEARSNLAEVDWAAGRWAEAEQHAEVVAQYDRETATGESSAYIQSLIAAGRGQVKRARALAAEGAREALQHGDVANSTGYRDVLGGLELSLDDPAAAIAWLEPAHRIRTEHGIRDPAMGVPSDLIEAYAGVGRIDDAQELLQWLLAAAERLDHPWARITGGRAAAVLHLALGEPAAGVVTVTPAAAEARALGLPLELARCLLVLGTAQRRTRQRREAAKTLDEAITVFEQLGAPCWAALAKAQRSRLAHAAESVLTPTEERIAELVAGGHTNAEIAAVLFIRTKTVETNLTRVYRKLGVRGRVDLARRLAT